MTDINRCLTPFSGITADYCENGMGQTVTLWGQNPVFFRSKYGGLCIGTTVL